jgi:coenzyme F420-reducing hydrogenase delta subunit
MSGGLKNSAPRLVVLYCANALESGADLAAAVKTAGGFTVRPVALPCSSKAELSHLLKLLAEGADAVQVIVCLEERCQFLVGSRRAEKRVERGRMLLKQIGMGEERLGFARGNGLKVEELMSLLERRAGLVRGLGKNPVSGEGEK